MMLEKNLIHWPAILKFSGEDELLYVSGHSEWNSDPDLHCFRYEEGDLLIDSKGSTYSLLDQVNNFVIPKDTSSLLDLHNIIEMIKAHESLLGSCCVSKLFCSTFHEAFDIVRKSNNA